MAVEKTTQSPYQIYNSWLFNPDMKIEYALKNNFGFGGTNGSLVFKKI